MWPKIVRDSILIGTAASALGLGVNQLRGDKRIPWVAEQDYQILVPCPEHVGQPASAMTPAQALRAQPGDVFVDGREVAAFARWHLPAARSVPFDYLEPNSMEQALLATSARRIIVYGDGGEQPDSGEQLAHAISGKGVKHVYFVTGGAKALQRALASAPKDPQ